MSSPITIAEVREKCKNLLASLPTGQAGIPRDVLIIAILVLASSASFGLGYLAGRDVGQGSGITLQELPPVTLLQAPTSEAPTQPVGAGSVGVVASKNGTKYYLPSCSVADRISAANKVWFASPALAVAAGYTPAANCKGI